MKRYIEVNALMEYCSNQKSKTISNNDIARFPTADVVEVVYCKDCRWYEDKDRKIFENCVRGGRTIPIQPTDYCSYGERRE